MTGPARNSGSYPKVMVVELRDETGFAEAAEAVGGALSGHGLKWAYGAVGASAEAVLAAARDRDDPPPGWAVGRADGARQWVVRDPAGRQVGPGWAMWAEAVREAWADHDRARRSIVVADVRRVVAKPGDVLVFTTPERLTDAEFDEIGEQVRHAVREAWGDDVRAVLFDGGTRLDRVVTEADEEPA